MARRNVLAREGANPKSNCSLFNGMHTRVRGRHPAIQRSSHGNKEADRPQRIAASAFCTGWPLYGWRRDQGLSDRYLCEDSLREGNLLSDPALFEGSD